MKISFLILLLSISINSHAGERLEGISGSMGKSANPFTKLMIKSTAIDNTQTDVELQAEQEASVSVPVQQDENSAPAPTEINPIAEINTEFDEINKPVTIEPKSIHKKPTQLFTHTSESGQTTNETDASIQAVNQVSIPKTPAVAEACVKEKVYSLDVDNAAQYQRLEDFPFTYECVTRR